MYVPATSAQPAVPAVMPLTPVIAITAGGSSPVPAGLATLGAAPEHVSLTVRRSDLNVLAGHTSTIAGALTPGLPGRVVALQALDARGWSTVASTHTGRGGRFRVRYVPRRTGSERVRLRFAGDSTGLAARRSLGRLNVYRLAQAGASSTSSFVRCVTMRESSMDWHIVDPPYSGGDQWTASTWLAAGGGRFAPIAAQATPAQQIWVFERYEPSHPSAWPVTVPACS
jgi:hypothetical protein